MTTALLETLLAPIAPDAPGGTDASHTPEWDDIRRLRQGDDPTLSQGEWVRDLQVPQWPKVRDLCETLLRQRSKDLQLAAWYAEALTHLEGFPGLLLGLRLMNGLLTDYVDVLFPADVDERIARLEWFNTRMPLVIRSVPMTSPKVGGYSHLRWEESRMVENLGLRDPKAKESALAEGKLSGESWDKAVQASGQSFFLRLQEQLQGARVELERLEKRVDQLFAPEPPSLHAVRESLRGCGELSESVLKRFGVDPGVLQAAAAPTVNLDLPAAARPSNSGGPIGSRPEAIRRLREVAQYFREHEPHSPVGLLAERAARWGEMSLEQWLAGVIKDEGTLGQLRDLLDLNVEL